MELEIERKFLLDSNWKNHTRFETLDMHPITVMHIEQTYLALVDEEEIRIRKIKHESPRDELLYTFTYKKGFGIERSEKEFPISEQLYEHLIEANGQPQPLRKTRTQVKWGRTLLEIDEYEQFQLCVVEVEFSNKIEAEHFQPPSWFGQEISNSKIYSNKQMWKKLQDG